MFALVVVFGAMAMGGCVTRQYRIDRELLLEVASKSEDARESMTVPAIRSDDGQTVRVRAGTLVLDPAIVGGPPSEMVIVKARAVRGMAIGGVVTLAVSPLLLALGISAYQTPDTPGDSGNGLQRIFGGATIILGGVVAVAGLILSVLGLNQEPLEMR